MTNILLIGGAGFIGSNIVAHLLESSIFNVSVIEPEFASVHRLNNKQIKIHRCELNNLDKIESILVEDKVDTIVHLVSTIIPGSNFDDYQREFTNVIFPSIRLMEFCSERNIKFVYFSSGGTIYGDRKGCSTPFKETDPMAPISYYGWSKQIMENSILYMHRTHNLKYIIIRPSNPYGKGQNINGKQGLIAVSLGKILSGNKIQIWGDGSAVRDYLYIDDLGEATKDIIADGRIINVTINLGSGVGYSVNEILAFIKKIVSEEVRVEYVASRQADVSSVILDTSKLQNMIPFHPIGIMEGIRNYYQELKNGE